MTTLFHGTDLSSAYDIMHYGLNAAKASLFNGSGEFWATTDLALASIFAQVNPAASAPACVAFEVPSERLKDWLAKGCVRVSDHDLYEFLPSSFIEANQCMTNARLVP
jgi:hypothetical protein